MFSEAFMSLSDERTSTSTQLAFSGCVLLLCRFVAVRSFFEGAVLAKPSPSMIVAPPYSHVVSGCYFPILTCSVCDVWVPSVLCFLLSSTNKKEAMHCCRVLTGWFKVIAPDSFRV